MATVLQANFILKSQVQQTRNLFCFRRDIFPKHTTIIYTNVHKLRRPQKSQVALCRFSRSPSPSPSPSPSSPSSSSHDAVVATVIYEVEVMVREPQEVLDGLRDHLSSQDLQLILLYFSQDGHDSWYALEVFDWMRTCGFAGDDARDLMMSFMLKWLMHTVASGGSLYDVNTLLQEMACVGLRPDADIIQALVIAYWDRGSKEYAFNLAIDHASDDDQTAVLALLWRMTQTNDHHHVLDLVMKLHERQQMSISSHIYNTALLAAISEQQQFTKNLRELQVYQKKGIVERLGHAENASVLKYENDLHKKAEDIASWAVEDNRNEFAASAYQKLLAMYCISGRGVEALNALLRLKSTGDTVQIRLFNAVLGICAYGNHEHETQLILDMMDKNGPKPDEGTFSALFGGFVKGGYPKQAINAFLEMLSRGIRPKKNLTLVAMKQVSKTNDISLVYKFGKRLVEAQLVEPFVVYLCIDKLKLSMILLL